MSVRTLIYVGPSLYGHEIEPWPDEMFLPPACQGDILFDLLGYGPERIVLIDGEFNQSIPVWVKEILYALADGVHFIGAASMGALRAAETWRYGAVGIGKIFEQYKSGEVEDDSYVAMTYDPETYRPIDEPPCGLEQKRIDALEAIEYSRRILPPFDPPFSKLEIKDIVTPVFDRILAAHLYG